MIVMKVNNGRVACCEFMALLLLLVLLVRPLLVL